MREINIRLLEGKEVRLFLPLTKQSDVIFKIGDNVIGCVDADCQRHYDYKSVGIFFDAEEFYNQEYLSGIHWVDCGLFTVDTARQGSLKLVNEVHHEYELKVIVPDNAFATSTMQELCSFNLNPFKKPLT